MQTRLTGLVAAPFTALNADGSINLRQIECQSEHLITNRVRGAFICGTTGEGLSLSLDERRQIARRWIHAAGKDLDVIIHVGHTCLADSQALAADAQKIGAHAISAMGPCFFRPAMVNDLVAYCRELAASAPGLPFYYYHIPSMTGVTFPMADFLSRAADSIPTLAGVKFTDENLMDYRQCLTVAQGRFDVLFGRDEILLAGLALGARGAVGSTYNYAAPIYHELIRCFGSGDLAEAQVHQSLAIRIIAQMMRCGGLAAGKTIMQLIGIDCGPVRLPLCNLTPLQRNELREGLTAAGFFDAVASAGRNERGPSASNPPSPVAIATS